MTVNDRIRTSIADYAAELIELSHDIHAHPEVGYHEFHAAKVTTELLERHGFAVEREIAGLATAFRATKGAGPLRLSFCVEFDALPDVGHACGHNIIAASSIGAALALADVADEVGATVVVFGTPCEEGGGGKIDIINAGYFDDVHASFMVHPWPTERLGATCLAVVAFDVTFHGKEAHASAAPWEGVNAVDALTLTQVAIGLLRQHLRPGDQVHHMVREGGSYANIIPAKAVAQFMCRSVSSERLAELRLRVEKCFQAAALATGTTYDIDILGHEFSHMESDIELLALYRDAAESLGRSFALDDAGEAAPTISTDMANVSLVTPSIHPLIKIDAGGASNHQPAFAAACVTPSADAAVTDGSIALAQTAAAAAANPQIRERLLAGRR